MNGVGCDDAALQRQALQKRDRRFRFATSVAGLGVGECHAHRHTPYRDHHRRHVRPAFLVGAPQALAIDRQNRGTGARTKRLPKGFHEANERTLKCRGIKPLEHTAEGVVARHPVLELKDGPKKSFLPLTEFRHLDTAFGTTKHGRERNKQHLAQVMPGIEVARIRHRLKYDKEIAHRRVLHNDEDTRQNPSSTKAQVEFYSHAIPLGFTRLAHL